ncbi:MAG TPA: hypothetical protein VHJ17_15565 [Thermomonospora sp.]|nr:hypothetical protein [Thermomonospora sp.]
MAGASSVAAEGLRKVAAAAQQAAARVTALNAAAQKAGSGLGSVQAKAGQAAAGAGRVRAQAASAGVALQGVGSKARAAGSGLQGFDSRSRATGTAMQGLGGKARSASAGLGSFQQQAAKSGKALAPMQRDLAKAGQEATKSGRQLGTASKGMRAMGPAGKVAGGGLKAVGAGFKAALGPAGLILLLLTPFIEKLVETVMQSKTFKKIVSGAMRGVAAAVKGIKTAALFAFNWVKNNWKKIPLILLAPFIAVPAALIIFRKQIGEKIGAAINWIRDNWKKILGYLTRPFTDGVKAVAREFGKILAKARSLPKDIGRAIGNVAGTLRSHGADLIGGFISGIVSKAGALISAIKNYVTDKIPGFVKKALGISSPSVVMMGLGRNVGEGMAIGIQQSGKQVADAMDTIAVVPARRPTRAAAVRAVARAGAAVGRAGGSDRRYEFHFHGAVRDPEETSRQFAARLRAWEVLNAVR